MDFTNLVKLSAHSIQRDTIVFTPETRAWCRRPYPGHPRGCPRFGKANLCPPKLKYDPSILNPYSHFYLAVARFDLKSYCALRLCEHPSWTERQQRCLLYWQPAVRNMLANYVDQIAFANYGKVDRVIGCGATFTHNLQEVPSQEAAGIDVFNTYRQNKIDFEEKPVNVVVLSSLICANGEITIPSPVEMMAGKFTDACALI